MKRTREALKRPIVGLGIVCIAAVLVSCSSKPEKMIVGRWQEIGGTETMEFFKDGTVRIKDVDVSLEGSYQFVEKDRVKFVLRGFDPLKGPMVEKISFSRGKLILTMRDGKAYTYGRLK